MQFNEGARTHISMQCKSSDNDLYARYFEWGWGLDGSIWSANEGFCSLQE